MDPRINYTLVGLFVLVLGSGIVAAAIWLSGRGDERAYQTYVAYMRGSVAGLNARAAVKYRGVNVGRIGLDGYSQGTTMASVICQNSAGPALPAGSDIP